MKRILIISPSQEGTIARCTKNIADALKPYHDVLIISLHQGISENILGNCECYDTAPKSAFMNLFSLFGKIKWVERIKKQFKPDITISTLTGCSTYNVLSKGTGKTIGIFHSPTDQLKTHYINYLMAELCFRFVYNQLNGLFCVSNEVSTYIKQHYGWIDEKKVKTVYNIHPINRIREKAIEELDNKEETDLFTNMEVYLFCGRLDVNKSPERLIKAFANAKLKSSNAMLVFIGQEWDYTISDIYKIADVEGVRDQVVCLGSKLNPYKYMKRSKCLVSTSKSEGLPGVIIESLILGTPVITTNSTCGVWEIFEESNNYESDLSNIHICHDGIITPNLKDEKKNILKLAEALNYSKTNSFPVPFPFIEKIEAKNIINDFLSI